MNKRLMPYICSGTGLNKITFSVGDGSWTDNTTADAVIYVRRNYTPVCPRTIKAPDGYHFQGWSPSIIAVTENKTYTAQFAETIPLNTVYFDLAGGTWTGGGGLTQSVADNGYATEPTMNPPVSNHPDHRYFSFISWDLPLGPITSNTTITASWQMIDF